MSNLDTEWRNLQRSKDPEAEIARCVAEVERLQLQLVTAIKRLEKALKLAGR